MSLTLLAFIGLVWLREQILHGGGPAWLEPEEPGAWVNQAQNRDPVNDENEEGDRPVALIPPADIENDQDNEEIIEQGLPEDPPPPEILDPVDVGGAAGDDEIINF